MGVGGKPADLRFADLNPSKTDELAWLLVRISDLRWLARKALADGGGSGMAASCGGDGVALGGDALRHLLTDATCDSGGGET